MDNVSKAFWMEGKLRINGIKSDEEIIMEIAPGGMPFYVVDKSYQPPIFPINVFDGGCTIRDGSNMIRCIRGDKVEIFMAADAIYFRR